MVNVRLIHIRGGADAPEMQDVVILHAPSVEAVEALANERGSLVLYAKEATEEEIAEAQANGEAE